jgi:signal transduction histidine kinase
MREGEPILVADAATDPRVWHGMHMSGLGPALYVPLGPVGDTLGTLVVGRGEGRPGFPDEVLRLIETFAGQAVIAVRLGAAAAAREQLAVLGDRDRIARDLHDLVIQRLFATAMSLEGALRTMPPEAAERVGRAVDDLDATIKEIRTSIFALQNPAPHSDEGLRAALMTAVHAAAAPLGFEPTLTFEGAVDTLVPPEVAEQMMAVVRETLSNAARHAGAKSVSVTVHADTNHVELVVADDGRGLPAAGRRSGLANLERRASALGGTFTASSGEDGGTVARWSVPLG